MPGESLLPALSTTGKVCEKSTSGDLSWSRAVGTTHASFTKTANNAARGQLGCGKLFSIYYAASEQMVFLGGVFMGNGKMLRMQILRKVGNKWSRCISIPDGKDRSFPRPSVMLQAPFENATTEQAWFGQLMGKSQCAASRVCEVDLREEERAWREGRGICFRHQQHSRTQHLSLAWFPCYSCRALW